MLAWLVAAAPVSVPAGRPVSPEPAGGSPGGGPGGFRPSAPATGAAVGLVAADWKRK